MNDKVLKIHAENVYKSFGKNEVLKGVSLDVHAVSYTHLRAHET